MVIKCVNLPANNLLATVAMNIYNDVIGEVIGKQMRITEAHIAHICKIDSVLVTKILKWFKVYFILNQA